MKKKNEDSTEESTSEKGEAAITGSSSVEVAKSSRCEDLESSDMIHTPQFHHPHHPHHRSFQVRNDIRFYYLPVAAFFGIVSALAAPRDETADSARRNIISTIYKRGRSNNRKLVHR